MSELNDAIGKESLPRHVAIIPDGNRRWAAARGLEPWDGHEAGAKNTERLVREARKLGIRELSLWGSSIENLKKRPVLESKALLDIYGRYLRQLIESEDIMRDRVRLRFIGRWREQFPAALKSLLEDAEKKTAHYDAYFLNFFLAYSGDDEMRLAIRGIADELQPGEVVTDEMIKRHLMTKDMPPVDLLIRTGGEPHLSAGFMMWDLAESQLYFSEQHYPDFDENAFREAIEDYAARSRRYGK
jgi:undecaprenyl diphosphate synthase